MLTERAIDILTEAVFTQACHDYVHGKKMVLAGQKVPEGCDPEEIKAFFRGEDGGWFPLMGNINPEYLIEKLDKQAASELA